MSKTAYEILNVSPTATDEEIKKQYHTLIRNLHSSFELESTETEEQFCRIREYNEAYEQLSRKNRAKYDASLEQQYNIKSDSSAYQKVATTNPNNRFSRILHNGYSLYGTKTNDAASEVKQEYFHLQSQRRKKEKELEQAKRTARLSFLRKAPTNAIQIGIEINGVDSEIVSLEFKRDAALAQVQQAYVFQASKRMINQKKREILKRQAEIETMKINEKYNQMIEEKRQEKEQLKMSLEVAKKKEQDVIGADPIVQEYNMSLKAIDDKISVLAVQLEKEVVNNYGSRISR